MWESIAVFMWFLLLVLGAAWKKEPQPIQCDPSCLYCAASRQIAAEQEREKTQYAICGLCFKRHKPSDPHIF